MPSKHRVAIITGSGRGIGRATAVALAKVGWAVVINDRGYTNAAAQTAERVSAAGTPSITVHADVSIKSDRDKLLQETLSHFGRVDLLVNNAGIGPRVRLNVLETTEESYDEVMAVNLKGPFFLTQAVANCMITLQQAGTIEEPLIVNIGSISGYTSSPSRGEYCLSKAGVGMMTALFADQLASVGIRVYEIRPGIIETDLTRVVQDKYNKLIAEGLTPIRRWGQPDDVARAVLAIAEGYLPFSTGEVINVDGGFHMRRL